VAHSVEVNITSYPLSREENGIVFVVADTTAGSASSPSARAAGRWRPRSKHQPHFMTWAEFDRSMREAHRD
jgi:hypothetical protein